MVRHGTIEIVLVGKAFVVDAKVLHRTAVGDDPGASGCFRGGVAKALQNIRDGVYVDVEIAAVDEFHLRRAFLGQVNVSVGQSWNGGASFEIDGFGIRTGKPANVIGVAGGDDSRSRAGQRFARGAVGRESADVTVV